MRRRRGTLLPIEEAILAAVSGLAFVALTAGYLLRRRLPKLAAGLLVLGILPGLVVYWGYGFEVGPLLAMMVRVGALQPLTGWGPSATGPATNPSDI